MSTPLDGVYAKLDRARFHTRDLHERLKIALHPDLYEFVRKTTGQPGEYVWHIERLPYIDPEWSLIIGDALTNLRACLDHLAYQLVVREGGTPDRDTVFPILLKEGVDGKGKPKPVSLKQVTDPAALAALDAVQPYSMAKEFGGPAAYTAPNVLKELVNFDKHSLLLLVAGSLRTDGMYWESDAAGSPTVMLNMQPLEDGDPVAWFTFIGRQPDPDFDPHLGIEIRLNSGPKSIAVPTRKVHIVGVLDRLHSSIEIAVALQFAPLFGLPPRHSGPLIPWGDR